YYLLISNDGIFDKAAPLYAKGYTLRQIAQELDVPRTTLRDLLEAKGVDLRVPPKSPKYKRSKNKATPIGNPPFGYTALYGRLVVEPNEFRTLKLIERLWKRGQRASSIAAELN